MFLKLGHSSDISALRVSEVRCSAIFYVCYFSMYRKWESVGTEKFLCSMLPRTCKIAASSSFFVLLIVNIKTYRSLLFTDFNWDRIEPRECSSYCCMVLTVSVSNDCVKIITILPHPVCRTEKTNFLTWRSCLLYFSALMLTYLSLEVNGYLKHSFGLLSPKYRYVRWASLFIFI